MKNLSLLAFAALVMVCFSSCSPKLTPFTQNLYQENKWTENELSQIQEAVSSA
jgi:outer membrane protein assembly factor BamE (lipoprotein component of BamABCDE complex)